jgi:hypothetical protein
MYGWAAASTSRSNRRLALRLVPTGPISSLAGQGHRGWGLGSPDVPASAKTRHRARCPGTGGSRAVTVSLSSFLLRGGRRSRPASSRCAVQRPPTPMRCGRISGRRRRGTASWARTSPSCGRHVRRRGRTAGRRWSGHWGGLVAHVHGQHDRRLDELVGAVAKAVLSGFLRTGRTAGSSLTLRTSGRRPTRAPDCLFSPAALVRGPPNGPPVERLAEPLLTVLGGHRRPSRTAGASTPPFPRAR